MPFRNCGSEEIGLSAVGSVVGDDCEIFICSASYEPRCLSVPLSLSRTAPRSVLVLKNKGLVGDGDKHASQLLDYFGSRASLVETTKKAAVKTADVISVAITNKLENRSGKVVVDITSMTHETLLVVFRLLEFVLEEGRKNVVFVYNPAEEYDPGTPFEEKWLSKGVDRVGSVLGFSGNLLPSKRNHLIVLVGFEVNRAAGLIDVFEPSSMSFGYGDDSSFNLAHKTVNQAKHERLSLRYPNAENFQFSPSDAHSVREIILEQARSRPEKNMIVAPMNTKISTLGCALAASENSAIQLCYGSAVTYNYENYSTSSKRCVVFTC